MLPSYSSIRYNFSDESKKKRQKKKKGKTRQDKEKTKELKVIRSRCRKDT